MAHTTTHLRGQRAGCCCGIGVCWIITLSILWTVVGIIFLCGVILAPSGASNASSASRLNPAEDFTSLGPDSCTVRDVNANQRTERTTRSQGNTKIVEWKCYHDYTYSVVINSSGQVFQSREESKLQHHGQCPPILAGPVGGKFFKGERAECWEPTSPGPWAPEYNCGNPGCMKVRAALTWPLFFSRS